MPRKNPDEKSGLEGAIDRLFIQMSVESPDSEAYAQMTKQLVKLYKLKEEDSKSRISPDTLAVVVGNIVGIVLIIGHERAHVLTSKALLFIQKMK